MAFKHSLLDADCDDSKCLSIQQGVKYHGQSDTISSNKSLKCHYVQPTAVPIRKQQAKLETSFCTGNLHFRKTPSATTFMQYLKIQVGAPGLKYLLSV